MRAGVRRGFRLRAATVVVIVVLAACSVSSPVALGQALDQPLIVEYGCQELSAGPVPLGGRMTASMVEGNEESDVVVEGVDHRGRPWRVQLQYCSGRTQVRSADINGDGSNEIVIAHAPGWVNGWCADFRWVPIIFLDSEGRPVPWRATSLGAEGHHAEPLPELGDWDGDGLAEWIELQCYSYAYKEGWADGTSGWTAVYEADGDYWRKLSVEEVDRRRAKYQSIAAEGRLLVPRRSELSGYVGDYGNKPTGAAVRIESIVKEGFLLSDGRSCAGFHGISIDRPTGRTVLVGYRAGSTPEGIAMLAEVAAGGYSVRLAGRREQYRCSPQMIWATAP